MLSKLIDYINENTDRYVGEDDFAHQGEAYDEGVGNAIECVKDFLEHYPQHITKGQAEYLANKIEDEFPNSNPLATLFVPYLGDVIAEWVRNRGRR